MTTPDNAEYFSRRACEERDMAAHASQAVARMIHNELAHRYSELARQATIIAPLNVKLQVEGARLQAG